MLRLLRNAKGNVMGIVLQWVTSTAPERPPLAQLPVRTLWRTCEICSENDAQVYCRAHSVYICVECLRAHELMERYEFPQECDGYAILASSWEGGSRCEYLSRSAAAAMIP